MKIYKICQISYRYGDENNITEYVFSTPDVRDNFYNLLYKNMIENPTQHEDTDEHTDDEFVYDDGGKWSYTTRKIDSNVIESFEVDENERINFKYTE